MQNAMSALPPIADICIAQADVRFVPIADIHAKQKDRYAAVSPKSDQVCFDQAAAFFRFLRQPSRPNRPRPVEELKCRWSIFHATLYGRANCQV